MGPATTTAPREQRSGAGRERRSLPRRHAVRFSDPGRATLDDRITALWTRLIETGAGECPVCDTGIEAGRACGSCGSELT